MTSDIAPPPRPVQADIVAYDGRNRLVLVAEVKSQLIDDPGALLNHLACLVGPVDYWLLADPEHLRLYGRSDLSAHPHALAVLDTLRTLTPYDPALAGRPLSGSYLGDLVESWLRDLALGWKSAHPPGSGELRQTGLIDRLANGSTRREATVDGDALR